MSTLAMSRVVSGATISSTTENNNQSAIEAVLNGGIEADNLADDAVGKAELNSSVVNAGGGLKQETDGSLSVDPSDTNPCVEAADGGVRVVADGSSIERGVSGLQVKAGGITNAMMAVSAQLPVGAVYLAVVSTNPATSLGYGTWSQIAQGKMLIGQNGSDADFDTAEETGGAKTHTLTVAEMPNHHHGDRNYIAEGGSVGQAVQQGNAYTNSYIPVGAEGGGEAHSIMNPYFVVYVFKRTA